MRAKANRTGSRSDGNDDEKRKCIHIHEVQRIHADYHKSKHSRAELSVKISFEWAPQEDVPHVRIAAKGLPQCRAPPRARGEDALGHTPVRLRLRTLVFLAVDVLRPRLIERRISMRPSVSKRA
jgi:hypothetical protein